MLDASEVEGGGARAEVGYDMEEENREDSKLW
jgi:hypothetical protein